MSATPTRRTSRTTTWVITAVLLVMAVVAGGMIWVGVTDRPYQAAPLPSSTFSAQRPTAAAPPLSTVTTKANPDDDPSTGDVGGSNTSSGQTGLTAAAKAANAAYANGVATGKIIPRSLRPNRLYVPTITGVVSIVDEQATGGYLNIPEQAWRAGRDASTAPMNATQGSTLIAGHVNIGSVAGPLHDLGEVKAGTLVYTTDSAGKLYAWRVGSLDVYRKRAIPTESFSTEGARRLRLVTCGGKAGRVTKQGGGTYYGYEDNVVATAYPVPIENK